MACLFCDIASGERGAHVVSRTERVVAFLDHRPLFPGHVLVVPTAHVVTLDEVSPELLGELFLEVQRTMRAVVAVTGAEGTFVANNNRVSQSVPHLHVHVVPRRKGDGLRGFFWPRQKYASDEAMAEMAERLRAARA